VIVHLARHGQTVWHRPNRYAGRSDIDLDDVGRAQAGQLARWAAGAGLDALVSSDLRRAIDTAAPAARATGLTAVVDARLREVDFGTGEGRTLADLDKDVAERFVADPVTHHLPGGEPPGAAAARARAALDDLAATYPDGRVLVVAHSTLIRLVVCAALGVPLGEYRRKLPALAPASRTVLRLDGGDPALLAYNVGVDPGCDA
jgi:2,3-bisphosphoglycerate-dependent phosphoglycerate mutase